MIKVEAKKKAQEQTVIKPGLHKRKTVGLTAFPAYAEKNGIIFKPLNFVTTQPILLISRVGYDAYSELEEADPFILSMYSLARPTELQILRVINMGLR